MKRFYMLMFVTLFLVSSLAGQNILVNPGFEDFKPALWSPLNGTIGSELGWVSTEQFSGLYSVSVTSASFLWHTAASGTYDLKAYVKTVGVNTTPANEDEKIGVKYEFLNASGAELTSHTIWADQATGSSDGWDTLAYVVTLSEAPATIRATAFMGKAATGTVYFDEVKTSGIFNNGFETIEGWLNWYSSTNRSYGTVTDNAAKTGSYSAELFKPDTTTSTSEIVYYSMPVAVEAGAWYKIGVWVKTAGVNDSIAFEPTYIRKERLDDRIGLCYFFHGEVIMEEGFALLGGDKYVYIDQTTVDKDWTHYVVAEQAPAEATGISVRARFTSNPTGTAWFDDFSVRLSIPKSSM
jgi:hypothetical protein